MDPGSSTYVATFDGKDALAELVEAEYLRRGGEHFRQVVALGDGAAWIWTMAGALYPHATHITDIYHAREHLTDLANHLAFITPDPAQWLADRNAELDAGNIEAIIDAARQYPLEGVKASELDKKLGYFEHNAHRMRYARLQEARHVHRLGRHRRRHQGHRRPARQTVRHALDRRGRRRHHRPALPARQRPVGRTLAASATQPPPGSAQPSDRHRDSDTQAAATGQDHPQQSCRAPTGLKP